MLALGACLGSDPCTTPGTGKLQLATPVRFSCPAPPPCLSSASRLHGPTPRRSLSPRAWPAGTEQRSSERAASLLEATGHREVPSTLPCLRGISPRAPSMNPELKCSPAPQQDSLLAR